MRHSLAPGGSLWPGPGIIIGPGCTEMAHLHHVMARLPPRSPPDPWPGRDAGPRPGPGFRPHRLRAGEGQRDRLRHELEPHGPPAPAGDDGLGRRIPRLRQRRATSTSSSSTARVRPISRRLVPVGLESSLPQPGRRHVRDVTEKAGVKGTATASASQRRLRQRRLDRPLRGRRDANILYRSNGDGTFADVTAKRRS